MSQEPILPSASCPSPSLPPGAAEEYRLFKDFFDQIPDVIYFKDREGRLTFVNRAHARGLGLEPEEVIGRTDYDFFPRDRADRMAKDDREVMTGGKSVIDKVERATRPDGEDNFVSTTKIPRTDSNGRIVGLVGITRDITRRARLERKREERFLLEKKLELMEDFNKLKMEFISTVSHELMTPLAIVKELVLLVFDETCGPVNPKQREVLLKTRNNIERLNKILVQLMDVASIENKNLTLRYALVNFTDLVKDSAEYFKALAREKGVGLSYDLPQDDMILFIDGDRINQVLINLVNNAVKFTEAGGSIRVQVRLTEDRVRVMVGDTGMGIAKRDLGRVFERFVQIGNPEGAPHPGIGVGLSIVKDLVVHHGGEVWVESRQGVGSKFYFTLPRYHTARTLEGPLEARVAALIKKGKPVDVVNMVIINYEDFKKRSELSPGELFNDFKEIMVDVLGDLPSTPRRNPGGIFVEQQKGRFDLVFSDTPPENVRAFCRLLKERTKRYLIQRRILDVFLSVGLLSFPSRAAGRAGDASDLKEFYISSEMRLNRRVNYISGIDVTPATAAPLSCRTIDLSLGGVCFLSPRPLKTDSKIRVGIELVKERKILSAGARVVWMRKLDSLPGKPAGKYKVGVEFFDLSEDNKNLLKGELKFYDE